MSDQPDLFRQEGYRAILMDPPWAERGGGKIKRGADRHYPLLGVSEILRVVQASPEWRPQQDCHLWMWTTSNHLRDAFWLMDELGFRYVTQAAWVKMRKGKLQKGLGQYLRHAHEPLFLGVRGNLPVPPPASRLTSVLFAERTRHSQKPLEQYDYVEACCPDGPYLEMFAREVRPRAGWTFWGNEV